MDHQAKKLLVFFLCLAMTLALCACGGNVKNVQINAVESAIYSEKDISAAVRVIIKEFDRSWNGCTLTSISYAGDERTRYESEYYLNTLKIYEADELIVLTSSFDVDETGGDGSLNPNSTYDGWSWILVRNTGGRWKHVDHGYG